ncbi:MAG: di-trans,poly-cis-decaprenylcistransferase [Candidatus Odinarchaeota archaeon]|nr:di-trans,poly-cis-decaprenylcistransferase [Candidatus Odinarchaeota archaeon]
MVPLTKRIKSFWKTRLIHMLLSPVYRLYSWVLWNQIKNKPVPQHIGVILDGNRRFGNILGIPSHKAHKKGAEKVEVFLDWLWELGVKVATLYTFSIENFNRKPEEVHEIMRLAKLYFERVLTDERVHRNKIRIKAIGRLDLLPQGVLDAIKKAEEATKDYDNHFLNVAIGYGGRSEIVDAVKKIAQEVKEGKIDPNKITEKTIEKHLYTNGFPDPDLIIRTSGEERLSGFLLWQSAYSELFFCEVFWPAIRRIDLWRAIRTYQQRHRRFGK